ncbi:uncharacterized protein LOC115445657 [Manduca sexta]|uniref:Uncharacterized protein n=1 Tax=Manduca sexta TaxID=7130 RepID=A0A922CPX7_MANSE|nr:uncharacterized protein LOC115445657 [Manduca sexta]XP_037299394.1 uncharacterized protein LOC115445657 [Manduca sexta]KAG6453528.1 hypothetical protein O3G_MSEX008178 [Manduca sexta]
MGGGQSVRATQFNRPDKTEADPTINEESTEHHISISNKMVERLVEDATLAGGVAAAAAGTPRGDYKDKMFMEKLKYMDEHHSERCGLTVEDLNAIAKRIELRTSNMVSIEPVCAECKQRVIDCYNRERIDNAVRCSDSVGAFTKCVRETATTRLRARTQKEARETARRSRHVAHARHHALRDLVPPPEEEATAI